MRLFQVFSYLFRTVEDDVIRKAYFTAIKKKSIDSKLEHALNFIKDKEFASALEQAETDEDCAESLLLAARLAFYQGAMEDVSIQYSCRIFRR